VWTGGLTRWVSAGAGSFFFSTVALVPLTQPAGLSIHRMAPIGSAVADGGHAGESCEGAAGLSRGGGGVQPMKPGRFDVKRRW